MVKDLLELAKLEAPSRRTESVGVDAEEALLSAWNSCSALAESKLIALENELSGAKTRVRGDMDELIHLFQNLLENAIRYSPEGGKITVSCRLENGTVTFEVRDKGPGIPKIELPRVFERFYRVEKHRDSGGGSTGLGLAISRHIVLNHGGKIWVESPPKGESAGTVFYFTLPSTGEQTEPSES
jgi:two-component system phosphate regulon sensor histidine kinase PhoR